MPRWEWVQVHVVVHEAGEVGFEVQVLQPLLAREVVDAASLRDAVGQVPLGVADRAFGPVRVLVFSSLHLGVGGVPVRHTHLHTHWDCLQSLQTMAFEDRHDLLERPQFVARRQQRLGELPDFLGRLDSGLVGGLPVEDSEDDLPDSVRLVRRIVLQRT